MGRRESKRALRRRSQSSGPARKARGCWASERPIDKGETCCPGSSGGANEPEIQWSPFSARQSCTLLILLRIDAMIWAKIFRSLLGLSTRDLGKCLVTTVSDLLHKLGRPSRFTDGQAHVPRRHR